MPRRRHRGRRRPGRHEVTDRTGAHEPFGRDRRPVRHAARPSGAETGAPAPAGGRCRSSGKFYPLLMQPVATLLRRDGGVAAAGHAPRTLSATSGMGPPGGRRPRILKAPRPARVQAFKDVNDEKDHDSACAGELAACHAHGPRRRSPGRPDPPPAPRGPSDRGRPDEDRRGRQPARRPHPPRRAARAQARHFCRRRAPTSAR